MLKESQNKTNTTAVRIGMIKQTSWSALYLNLKEKAEILAQLEDKWI